MRFGFDDDQIEIQRTATALLEARSALDRVRENAEAGTDDNGLWTELSELGWPGIAISEDFGGQGFGLVELAILLEQAGRTLAAVPLLSTATAALAIQTAGSDEQKERWLPSLATGEISGAIGVAVNGRCEVAACAPTAAVAVLFDEEGGARLVDLADALVEPVATIDPTRRYSSIEGPGVELPGDTDAAFDRAISAMSAELTGVASRATELAVAYVKERKQFGTPVGAYQAVAHMCAECCLVLRAPAQLPTTLHGLLTLTSPSFLRPLLSRISLQLRAHAMSPQLAFKLTEGLASHGKLTRTGSTSVPSWTHSCLAVPASLAHAWLTALPTALVRPTKLTKTDLTV
ncbi:MAG: acyl-CoA dehydrogenase family protein [Actinomycetes bacterium]